MIREFLSIGVPVDLYMQEGSWVTTGLMVFARKVPSTHLTGAIYGEVVSTTRGGEKLVSPGITLSWLLLTQAL